MSTCPLHEKAKMLYHQRFFWSLWLMQLICFDAVEPPDSSPEFQLRRSQRWVPMKIGRPPSLVAPGKSALVKKTLGQGVSLDFIKQTKINQLYIGSFRWKDLLYWYRSPQRTDRTWSFGNLKVNLGQITCNTNGLRMSSVISLRLLGLMGAIPISTILYCWTFCGYRSSCRSVLGPSSAAPI